MVAKTCGCKDKTRKVTYSFVDSFHSLCRDKKDIIMSEIQACQKIVEIYKRWKRQDHSLKWDSRIKVSIRTIGVKPDAIKIVNWLEQTNIFSTHFSNMNVG